MYSILCRCTLFSGFILYAFAFAIFTVNFLFFHFIGNNYIPEGAYEAGFYLLIILFGVKLSFHTEHYLFKLMLSIVCVYFVMASIALLTNAVQFTPFNPIDEHIVSFEKMLHIDMAKIMAWASKHSWLHHTLTFIYGSLAFQLCSIPVIVAAFGQFYVLKEHLCLMLISAIIGFSFYYFFPTTAPASIIHSPFFLPEQYATGIKFKEIHNSLSPTTIAGGLIALPSFHVIWAWLCLYALRFSFLFFILLPFNILLVISCVLLGWHYPVDIVGSFIVIFMTHAAYCMSSKKIIRLVQYSWNS